MSVSRPLVALLGVGFMGIAAIGAGASATFTTSTASTQTITAGKVSMSLSAPNVPGCTSAADHCHALTLPAVGPVGSTFETPATKVTMTNTGNIPTYFDAIQITASIGGNAASTALKNQMNICIQGKDASGGPWVEGNGPLTTALALHPSVVENPVKLQPGQSAVVLGELLRRSGLQPLRERHQRREHHEGGLVRDLWQLRHAVEPDELRDGRFGHADPDVVVHGLTSSPAAGAPVPAAGNPPVAPGRPRATDRREVRRAVVSARHSARRTGARRWAGNVALAVVLGLAALGLAAVISGGYQIRPILSGSMRPGLPVGGVVVTERVPISDLEVRDVVVLHPPDKPEELVVHRIISLTPSASGPVVETQGDANDIPDPWSATLQGDTAYRVVLSLPWIGYAAVWAHSPIGRRILFGLGAALVVAALGGLVRPGRAGTGARARDDVALAGRTRTATGTRPSSKPRRWPRTSPGRCPISHPAGPARRRSPATRAADPARLSPRPGPRRGRRSPPGAAGRAAGGPPRAAGGRSGRPRWVPARARPAGRPAPR